MERPACGGRGQWRWACTTGAKRLTTLGAKAAERGPVVSMLHSISSVVDRTAALSDRSKV
jgi:hypothetical protein